MDICSDQSTHNINTRKKSSARFVPDVEPITPGVYNETILELMDVLMYKAYNRGIKLLIAMHDRYALGCWNTDAYATEFKLPTVVSCGSQYNIPLRFYRDANVIAVYDQRIKHVLTHKNPYFNNRTWGSIGEAIYAFDVQHSSQANFPVTAVRNATWLCGRAKNMKSYLSNGILIASGGSEDYANSLYEPIFQCPHIDIVSLRDGSNDPNYIGEYLKPSAKLT
jgi:mannan endo-1,4-beta-mannosidase